MRILTTVTCDGRARQLCRLVVALLLVCAQSTVGAGGEWEPFAQWCLPTLTLNEKHLLDDSMDGQLDGIDFLDACLVASEIVADEQDRRQLLQRWAMWSVQCRALLETVRPHDDVERAAIVFEFLHRRVLTGDYEADVYDVVKTIRDGNYNCLASAILFQALCTACDVPVRGWSEPGHVCCELDAPRRTWRIQTTVTDWQAATSAASYAASRGRPVTQVNLLAKLFFNRSVTQQFQAQHPQAFASAWIAVRLDPQDLAARDNLAACLNNWALAECSIGAYQMAEDLLTRGLQWQPEQEHFLHNLRYLDRVRDD